MANWQNIDMSVVKVCVECGETMVNWGEYVNPYRRTCGRCVSSRWRGKMRCALCGERAAGGKRLCRKCRAKVFIETVDGWENQKWGDETSERMVKRECPDVEKFRERERKVAQMEDDLVPVSVEEYRRNGGVI